MKGMKRLFEKAPRWQVHYERTGGKGAARWMTDADFHDPVRAFEHASQLCAVGMVRVWDRMRGVEVLWPYHDYRLPARQRSRPLQRAFLPEQWGQSLVAIYKKSSFFNKRVPVKL